MQKNYFYSNANSHTKSNTEATSDSAASTNAAVTSRKLKRVTRVKVEITKSECRMTTE